MIDPAIWDEPDMRAALACRDMSTVYSRLVAAGVQQRQIAELTGQRPSEIWEIIKGRQVVAYDLLRHIAGVFGIPCGYMGLAYDVTSAPLAPGYRHLQHPEELSEEVKRRIFLASVANELVGEPVLGKVLQLDVAVADTPLPAKIGRGEVKALHSMTEHFRALGRAGYGVPDVLSMIASRADRMLTVPKVDSDVVRRALLSQLSDLHTLAGWWCHDMHLGDLARWHYGRALQLANEAVDVFGMVSAVRHAAASDQERGAPNDALKLYQLAIVKLADVHDRPELSAYQASLHVRAACALAQMDRPDDVYRELQRAADLSMPGDPFARAWMDHNHSLAELALGRVDAAEQLAVVSVSTWSEQDRRDSARARITLATTHVIAGESDAPRLAAVAIDAVAGTRSMRNRASLLPLEQALAARTGEAYVDLAQRARELRVTSV